MSTRQELSEALGEMRIGSAGLLNRIRLGVAGVFSGLGLGILVWGFEQGRLRTHAFGAAYASD